MIEKRFSYVYLQIHTGIFPDKSHLFIESAGTRNAFLLPPPAHAKDLHSTSLIISSYLSVG